MRTEKINQDLYTMSLTREEAEVIERALMTKIGMIFGEDKDFDHLRDMIYQLSNRLRMK